MNEENNELNDKENVGKQQYFNKKLLIFLDIIKNKPLVSLACLGFILILIFYGFSEHKVEIHAGSKDERQSREEISGVEKAVDPRARWTEEILSEVKNMKNQLEKLIETKYLETNNRIDQINDFNQKLESLENQSAEQVPMNNNFDYDNHIRARV